MCFKGINSIPTAVSLGFSVYISNTTDKESGVLCFRDTTYTKSTIPNPVNIACPYHGRTELTSLILVVILFTRLVTFVRYKCTVSN